MRNFDRLWCLACIIMMFVGAHLIVDAMSIPRPAIAGFIMCFAGYKFYEAPFGKDDE